LVIVTSKAFPLQPAYSGCRGNAFDVTITKRIDHLLTGTDVGVAFSLYIGTGQEVINPLGNSDIKSVPSATAVGSGRKLCCSSNLSQDASAFPDLHRAAQLSSAAYSGCRGNAFEIS
jgi:hypothetical protein